MNRPRPYWGEKKQQTCLHQLIYTIIWWFTFSKKKKTFN